MSNVNARRTRGRNGYIPYVGLDSHGFSINDIKLWRKKQFDAGLPSEIEEFFRAHGLCVECLGEGVKQVGLSLPNEQELATAAKIGLSQLPFFEACPICKGSGKGTKVDVSKNFS